MQLDTIRFGMVELDEEKILTFPEGLPGLEDYKRFAILQFEESYPIIWLQSTEDGGICLPVIDPFLALPDYAFNIEDEHVNELDLTGPEEIQVISVLVIPDNVEKMTINLAAPIVINLRSGQAKQVILNNGEYNVRFPIFGEIYRLFREVEADAGSVEKG